ncbi:MAG TPA: c-type cytochrome [Candidatus Tenderia sp.]|nr:c-type cytochrome [Candidatus Tenderia sp.]
MKSVFSSQVLVALFVSLSSFAATLQAEESVESLYREHCAVCHGDRGDGQTKARYGLEPAPRNFTTTGLAQELSRERMIQSITEGRAGTAMVGWQGRLSDEQIASLADYIRTTFMYDPEAVFQKEKADQQAADLASSALQGESHFDHGKRLYKDNCRVCHGDRGNSATWTNTVLDPAPRNFTTPQSRRILTRERMLASVRFGRKGTAMMPFSKRLSHDDIAAVVDYIRATFMTGHVIAEPGSLNMGGGAARGHGGGGHAGRAPSGMAHMAPKQPSFGQQPSVDMTAPFPGELVGDFKKGRYFYMSNCVHCHGVRGDGHGPRSSFINPKPRNFIHPESRKTLNRPALFQAIVIGKPGTPMPAWGQVLGPQEVADVAEFVFQDFIHPDPNINRDLGEFEDEAGVETEAKKKAR